MTKERNDAQLKVKKSDRIKEQMKEQFKRDKDFKKGAREKHKKLEAKVGTLGIQEKRLQDQLATRKAECKKLQLQLARGGGQSDGPTLCHACGRSVWPRVMQI